MDDLDYETHLEIYKRLFGYYVDNPDINKANILISAEEKAKHHHAICVFDPLRDLIYETASASEKLANKNAKYFMLYGAARRTNLIFSAYQDIRSMVYEKRTQPLSPDQQVSLSQAINNTYIHLLGILDNFAWCLVHERQGKLADIMHRNDVGLFSKKFRKQCVAYSEIAAEIETHDTWHKDVKERRNPVAHRIPLYVPPALLTADQAEHYSAINNLFSQKLNDLALDEAGNTLGQLDFIGSFFPYFVHHPDEPIISIYPTIPTDLSHLIRIWRTVSASLLRNEC